MSFIKGIDLVKQYGSGDTKVTAISGINFEVKTGEFVSIMGESGSGKSTLLSIMGAMNSPTLGEFYVDEINIYKLKMDQRADFRREYLGFIFQSFHLVPYLTALENVMLPLTTTGLRKSVKREMAAEALEKVGLKDKIGRLPNQLSGGEMERVAIARAIVNNPPILLADEPTGNLDSSTSHEMMKMIQKLNSEGMTILMVTHSSESAAYADRIMLMADGKISDYNFNFRKYKKA